MLDLEKFSKETKVTVPIVHGYGQKNGRMIYSPGTPDNWYIISLGDKTKVERPATRLEIIKEAENYKQYQVYALGTEGVPVNFDMFYRLGLKEAEEIYFLSLPIFSTSNVILHEDGRLYFVEEILPKNRAVLTSVRESFNKNETIKEIKGVTPEIRYYYLVLNLQRESQRALEELKNIQLKEEEYQKRLAEFKATFGGRLEEAIKQAGGQLIRYSKIGTNYLIEWKIGNQIVKSTIRDDLRIISAGFCLSGDDRKHTMNSIVHLAKMFRTDAPLYITRE